MHGEYRPAWACSLPASCLGYVSAVLADALLGRTSSVVGRASVLSADENESLFSLFHSQEVCNTPERRDTHRYSFDDSRASWVLNRNRIGGSNVQKLFAINTPQFLQNGRSCYCNNCLSRSTDPFCICKLTTKLSRNDTEYSIGNRHQYSPRSRVFCRCF